MKLIKTFIAVVALYSTTTYSNDVVTSSEPLTMSNLGPVISIADLQNPVYDNTVSFFLEPTINTFLGFSKKIGFTVTNLCSGFTPFDYQGTTMTNCAHIFYPALEVGFSWNDTYTPANPGTDSFINTNGGNGSIDYRTQNAPDGSTVTSFLLTLPNNGPEYQEFDINFFVSRTSSEILAAGDHSATINLSLSAGEYSVSYDIPSATVTYFGQQGFGSTQSIPVTITVPDVMDFNFGTAQANIDLTMPEVIDAENTVYGVDVSPTIFANSAYNVTFSSANGWDLVSQSDPSQRINYGFDYEIADGALLYGSIVAGEDSLTDVVVETQATNVITEYGENIDRGLFIFVNDAELQGKSTGTYQDVITATIGAL